MTSPHFVPLLADAHYYNITGGDVLLLLVLGAVACLVAYFLIREVVRNFDTYPDDPEASTTDYGPLVLKILLGMGAFWLLYKFMDH